MVTACRWMAACVVVVIVPITGGCSAELGTRGAGGNGEAGGGQDETVAQVAAKAADVSRQVGGASGFGGTAMDGYREHAEGQIDFNHPADLADSDTPMTVRVHNQAQEEATFRLHYFAGHMGLDEQILEVTVGPGETVPVQLPCAEIVGLGPLEMPGEAGCHFADAQVVDNVMAVPGFLGLDFECGGVYECFLTEDIDDLDGDGDVEELIVLSEAMQTHLMNGGPMGHMHGHGSGMMGPHHP